MAGISLGKQQTYETEYNPKLLQAVARGLCRAQLVETQFVGEDVWTGYELSWLNTQGKPVVASAEFFVPCDSPNIIESKSFKYYLNSFNQSRFENLAAVERCLKQDLSHCAGAPVGLKLYTLDQFLARKAKAHAALGECVDDLPVACAQYSPEARILELDAVKHPPEGERVLVSHLLKSNCPVTGQPDWASVWVGMAGAYCTRESFLRYVVSFRGHQDFHEHCVERMYNDIWAHIQPAALWVYARYTRRGGLDINPFRASQNQVRPDVFGVRQ